MANAPQESVHIALKQIMTPNPITVDPEAPLSDVLYLLNRYQLSRLPVVEGDNKLVGIITRTDIIREEVSQLGGKLSILPIPPTAYTKPDRRWWEKGAFYYPSGTPIVL
ncbi:CBS domain-containing protein [Synechocystis sp. B12]|nr:CBS domain-containing protein [Synechocystis sp. B12]